MRVFALSLLVASVAGATNPTAPPSAPTTTTNSQNPFIWIHDPNVSTNRLNVSPRSTASCSTTQAVGLYNDGGVTDVVCVNSSTVTGVNTPPTTTTLNTAVHFDYVIDGGWPSVPMISDAVSGTPYISGLLGQYGAFGKMSNWVPQCWGSVLFAGTTLAGRNFDINSATNGCTATLTWSSASFMRRQTTCVETASGANATASSHLNGLTAWLGNSAGLGGFLIITRFAPGARVNAGERFFIGMAGTTSAIGAADPSASTNTAYLGCDVADSNFHICSNDTTGTATCADLGANFPCKTANAYYEFWLYAPPNATYMLYYVQRLDSAFIATGQITSDLPQNTVQLGFQITVGSASTGSAMDLNFGGVCEIDNIN